MEKMLSNAFTWIYNSLTYNWPDFNLTRLLDIGTLWQQLGFVFIFTVYSLIGLTLC